MAAGPVLFLCTANYYRSRFAELLFNELAAAAGLEERADSAGLARGCGRRNPGPLSPHARAGLAARGIVVPTAPRGPRDVTEDDLAGAAVIVALKESEHRPYVEERFPTFADRVRYWTIDDVPQAPPARALAALEERLRALVAELAAVPEREQGGQP